MTMDQNCTHRSVAVADDETMALHPVYLDYAAADFQQARQLVCVNAEVGRKLEEARERDMFPVKLHRMIEYCSNGSDSVAAASDVIRWLPHGRAFIFFDRDQLVKDLLPRFMDGQNKFASFQRQLNLYGFLKLTGNHMDKGAYYHQLFLRSRPDLSKLILPVRHTLSGAARSPVRRKFDPLSEPKFFEMTPLPLSMLLPDAATTMVERLESTETATTPFGYSATMAHPPLPPRDVSPSISDNNTGHTMAHHVPIAHEDQIRQLASVHSVSCLSLTYLAGRQCNDGLRPPRNQGLSNGPQEWTLPVWPLNGLATGTASAAPSLITAAKASRDIMNHFTAIKQSVPPLSLTSRYHGKRALFQTVHDASANQSLKVPRLAPTRCSRATTAASANPQDSMTTFDWKQEEASASSLLNAMQSIPSLLSMTPAAGSAPTENEYLSATSMNDDRGAITAAGDPPQLVAPSVFPKLFDHSQPIDCTPRKVDFHSNCAVGSVNVSSDEPNDMFGVVPDIDNLSIASDLLDLNCDCDSLC